MFTDNPSEKDRLTQGIQKLQGTVKQSLTLLNKQTSHQHCVLCGTTPLLGLKLNFYDDNNDQVWAYFTSSIHQQDYQDILHGDFLSTLLDSSMCQAIFGKEIEAVTADMNIRFLHEVNVNSHILMMGKVTYSRPPLYKVEGQLYVDSQLVAKSTARFMLKGFGKNKKK